MIWTLLEKLGRKVGLRKKRKPSLPSDKPSPPFLLEADCDALLKEIGRRHDACVICVLGPPGKPESCTLLIKGSEGVDMSELLSIITVQTCKLCDGNSEGMTKIE